MYKFFKKICSFVFVVSVCMVDTSLVYGFSLDRNNSLRINYTVPPEQEGISGTVDSGKSLYYSSTVFGGMHDFLKKVVDGSAIDVNYIPYDSYSKALQNSMVYADDKPEVIVGITYDENNLKYLEYFSYPVFVDYLVLVVDSRFLPAGFKPTKHNLEDTILKLSSGISIVRLENKKLPLSAMFDDIYKVEEKRNVADAMEDVVVGKAVLVATNSDVQYYLNNNNASDKVRSLIVYKYPKLKVNYFMAVNKKSNLYTQKYNDEILFIEKLKQNVVKVLNSNNDGLSE